MRGLALAERGLPPNRVRWTGQTKNKLLKTWKIFTDPFACIFHHDSTTILHAFTMQNTIIYAPDFPETP
jgi:hypothetical protein